MNFGKGWAGAFATRPAHLPKRITDFSKEIRPCPRPANLLENAGPPPLLTLGSIPMVES